MTDDIASAPMNPGRCPLCQAPNVCAMDEAQRTGQPPGPCWCVNATFTPELMAQLSDAARGKACICAACVARGGPPN